MLRRVRDLTSRLVFNRSYVNIATSDKRYLFSIRGDGDIRSSIGQKTMDYVVLDLIRDDLDIHLGRFLAFLNGIDLAVVAIA